MAEQEAKIPQFISFADEGLQDILNDTTKAEGVAYSGGPIRQGWSDAPVYVSLAGLEIAPQVPLLFSHTNDPNYRLGECAVENNGKELRFLAELDNTSRLAERLVAQRQWKWGISIGATNDGYEYVMDGTKATVNGREIEGPALIVSKSMLREISVVAVGADPEAYMQIAASLLMETPEQTKTEEKKIISSVIEAKDAIPAEASQQTQEPPTQEEDTTMAEELKAKLDAMEQTVANLQARLDEQSARPAPEISVSHDETPKADVLACAIEQSMGIEQSDTRAAEMASKAYKGQMGLRQLYTEAAQAAGWNGSYINNGNYAEATNAIKAGFSNINLPGILGNAVNKRIKAGYDYAESSWREIAEITSVSDYKAFSTYTLNAKGDFEEVPNGGTIPHGELAETGYENQLKRYGQMFQVDEIDVINDDLGAINARAFGFGRKAGLKLNKVFWARFQDDAAVFSAANGNLVTGATPLSVNSLGPVVKAFRDMKDSNGDILGYVPAVLLVPTALEVEALKLYNDSEMRDNTASKVYLTGNPFRSQFKPVASAYLSSATNYYLLADPRIAATIQVAFLDGQTAPVVESSAAEFDVFGIRWRAKFSFGVAFADPKAGVKATA